MHHCKTAIKVSRIINKNGLPKQTSITCKHAERQIREAPNRGVYSRS
jgi:hypothetical protein